LPVDIIRRNNDYKIVMIQGKIEFGEYIEDENRKSLLSALGIKEDDLLKSCPIQIVSTGHSKVMIGIKSNIKLNELKPSYDGL